MNRAAIVWVEDYEGQDDDLTLSRETAEGFADALGADLVLTRSDRDALEGLFLPGQSGMPAEIEKAHILYFSGHGTDDGPLLFGGGVIGYNKVVLGGGDLAFAVFDCCKSLARAKQWAKTFGGGLHYMLGFSGDVHQSASRGKLFAEFLDRGESIPRAWVRAATETGGSSWSVIRAVRQGRQDDDEVWSRDVAPVADPTPPTELAFLSHQDERLIFPSEPERRSEVKMFSIRKPEWRAGRVGLLREKLGPRDGEDKNWTGSIEIRGDRSSLELYDTGASFWWTLRGALPPAAETLFLSSRDSAAEAEKIVKSLALPVTLSSEAQVTSTNFVREAFEGGPPESPQVVERHVHRRLELEGLPVLGPGAKMRISFRGEAPSGALVFWRDVELAGVSVPIISPEEAAALVRAERSFARIRPERVKLHGSMLGYYSLPPRIRQDRLVPVYCFQGLVKRRTSDFRFIRYVQAVPEEIRREYPESSVMRTLPTVFS